MRRTLTAPAVVAAAAADAAPPTPRAPPMVPVDGIEYPPRPPSGWEEASTRAMLTRLPGAEDSRPPPRASAAPAVGSTWLSDGNQYETTRAGDVSEDKLYATFKGRRSTSLLGWRDPPRRQQ